MRKESTGEQEKSNAEKDVGQNASRPGEFDHARESMPKGNILFRCRGNNKRFKERKPSQLAYMSF